MATRTQRKTRQWPACHGAMAALIRASQWRVSPLGAIETWPQALKTAVEIMLHSRQPAYVCWGRSLTTLYNDAAIGILGPRHPRVLGRPYAEVFPDTWDDIKPVIEAARAGEAQHVVGQRISHGDHPASWYTYTWTPLDSGDGRIAGLYCVATETALNIGDEQLRTVLENARDAVSMLDLASGRYVFVSPSHVPLTGFSHDELKAFTPADFRARLHPDDIERLRHPALGQSDASEGTTEYRWKVKSGEYRWFSVSRKLVRDDADRPIALVNVNRDVTERKRAELEMLASRATLKAALSSMTDAVYITDADGRFLQVNDSFVTFHRYKTIADCATTFRDFVRDFDVYFPDGTSAGPEDRPVSRALRGESAVGTEYRLVRKDSGEAWIGSFSFGPIRDERGAITGAVVTARDVTEAHAAADALRRSEARLAIALESAEMGSWEWDLKTNTVIRSAKIYELLGIEPLSGADDADTFWRMVDPEDRKRVLAGLEEIKRSGRDWRDEFRVYRPDGSVRWIVGVGRLIRDPDGSARTMYGINYEITDQKRAEAELRRSEARYRLLHETQRDGFVQVAMDGRILDCNAIYCDLLGYSRAELEQLTYTELTPDRWHAAEARIVETQIIPRGYSDIYEKEYCRKDGSVFPVELRTILARDDSGAPASMWALVRDLSERRAAESRMQSLKEQLMHVGRVNELSQVSAGIAHELNQPLAAMLNYSATAKRLIAKKDIASIEAAALAIARAGEQAMRAGTIIRRMRDFVEKRDTYRVPDDINAIVKEAADLGLIGAKADGIDTVLALEPDLPVVNADRIQIEQVLVNLLHNAMDAMAGCKTRRLVLATRRTGGGVEVSVSDTGSGIADALEEKLFQPFITTKPTGMGIGLAISRSIIEAHGGEITAHSHDGTTVFRFTLPA